MSEKQEQSAVGLKAWLEGGEAPADFLIAYDEATVEDRTILFVQFDALRGGIDRLAQIILELDLRGTEDLGAVAVAGIRLMEQKDEIQALKAKVDALEAKLAERMAQLAKERGKSRALAAAMPAKPRRFKEPDERFEPVPLLGLIEAADEVEIAFLDAKGRELQGVAPAKIEGGAGAFRRSGARLLLQLPSLPLTSPTQQDLCAYCLLLDGEVAAYAKRSGPLGLPPSTTYELKDDVVF